MPKVPLTFVKSGGAISVIPEYEAGKFPKATLEEAQAEIQKYSGKTDEWSKNYISGLQQAIKDIQSGTSPYALDKSGVLTTQKALESQAKQRQQLASGEMQNIGTEQAPLLVPKGTPSPEEANRAFQAGQPTPTYQTTATPQTAQPSGYGPSSYTGVSIVDYLKSLGKPSDFTSRTQLAQQMGIQNYTGTAEQNTQLLATLRGQTGQPTQISQTSATGQPSVSGIVPDEQIPFTPFKVSDFLSGDMTTNDLVDIYSSSYGDLDIKKYLDEQVALQQQYLEKLKPAQQEIDLQNELVNIQGRIQAEQLSTQAGINSIMDELVSTRVMVGEQESLLRQSSLRQQVLAAQENNLLARLGIEQKEREIEAEGVETAMGFTQQNLETMFTIQDRIRQEKMDYYNLTSTLQGKAQNTLNSITSMLAGSDVGDLDSATITQLQQLSTQAGIPWQVVQQGLKVAKDEADFKKLIEQRKTTSNITRTDTDTEELSQTTKAIIDNPNLLSNLTPTIKGQVISELQGAGYDVSGLGDKPLSDTAIKEITQTRSAIENLNSLKQTISDNLEFIGPIKGLAALNPWSKAKKVQADIDRIKQVVGKALEGGVLRKEDEEKYKKILAQITDTPETAMYKIDQLVADIQGDIDDYTSLQQGAGRSLDVKSSLQKTDLLTGQTKSGNSYTITKE